MFSSISGPLESAVHPAPGARSMEESLPAAPFREKPEWWGETWNIGIIPHPLASLLEHPHLLEDIRWPLEEKKGLFRCDPWLAREGGRDFLFFEEFDRAQGKGKISCAEVTGTGMERDLVDINDVLVEPFHLSHPCVFQADGVWYMIPEAASTGQILAYEAVDFPRRWSRKGILIRDFPGLDPTVIQRDGFFYLFCNKLDGDHEAQLFVFFARNLAGPWQSHPGNPVKTTRRGSRPAGSFVEHRDCLIRPGQDSRWTYGKAVICHEVTEFSPSGYDERPIATLESPAGSPFPHGCHTLCVSEQYCIVDAKRYLGLKKIWGPVLEKFRMIGHFGDSIHA